MLTPSQLKEYEFKNAGRNAYKSDDVDDFFAEVTASYEKMFRENGELVKRVGLLADRLEQYKKDEADIKSAVISAQKAADMIVKDAENSVIDSKSEAEAILSAAKGEAEIIKKDAERQAVADSELLLSITRDKAQEIIQKAKDEAGSIIINAKSSASDKVGEATRTITSESLLYDMLKKEVSEFKANILAQYKAHIELISKLPEIAAEKAEELKSEEAEPEENTDDFVAEIPADEIKDDVEEDTAEEVVAEPVETEVTEAEPEITFVSDENDASDEIIMPDFAETEEEEEVIKTELPFDFFSDDSSLEFVESDINSDDENSSDIKTLKDMETSDYGEKSRGFSVDIGHLNFSADDIADDEQKSVPEDIPVSKGFFINKAAISNDLDDLEINPTDSFETVDADDDDDDKPHKKGFFRRK